MKTIETISIAFAKVKPQAMIPCKREEDAAFDIYPCFKEDYVIIRPHETKMIPTGIASCCDLNYCFILKERGSTGTKGIAQRCGVIDSGYRGEWFVPLTNTTTKPIVIVKNDKNIETIFKEVEVLIYPYNKAICQALVIPVPKVVVNEMDYDSLCNVGSERMRGALGSSGK